MSTPTNAEPPKRYVPAFDGNGNIVMEELSDFSSAPGWFRQSDYSTLRAERDALKDDLQTALDGWNHDRAKLTEVENVKNAFKASEESWMALALKSGPRAEKAEAKLTELERCNGELLDLLDYARTHLGWTVGAEQHICDRVEAIMSAAPVSDEGPKSYPVANADGSGIY